MLESWFQLRAHGSNPHRVLAGLSTFLTMAYILFVNPEILAAAGMPRDAVFVATCLAAAFGSMLMGLYANYPIAMAPGMGLNAYFAFTVVRHARLFVAGGARRGVHLRPADRRGQSVPGARVDRQRDPALAEAGDLGRHRPVPGDHRPQERGHDRSAESGHLRAHDGRPACAGHACWRSPACC
jgi:hypothetical protein